jgi:lipopolysaccharide export system protein LptA
MIRAIIAVLACAMFACGCHAVKEDKYEKGYFVEVAKKVAEAEKLGSTPVPTAVPATATQAPVSGQLAVPGIPTVTPAASKTDAAGQLAAALPAATATRTATPAARVKKYRIRQLEIEADAMTFNKDTSIAVFTGDVVLSTEGVRLKCDTLTSKNYKDSAEATGNVSAWYKAQKTFIKCGRIKYGDRMSSVQALDGVYARKYLDNGNTVNMHADQIDFETEYGSLAAKKVRKKVKVDYNDMVAFSDKVVYNDDTSVMEMTGRPVVRKSGSSFTADRIVVDTAKKKMKLESGIWSRIFYGDLKNAETEVRLETDKNPAPGKNIQ